MVSVLCISLRTSHVLQGSPAQPKLYRFGQMFAADPLRTGEIRDGSSQLHGNHRRSPRRAGDPARVSATSKTSCPTLIPSPRPTQICPASSRCKTFAVRGILQPQAQFPSGAYISHTLAKTRSALEGRQGHAQPRCYQFHIRPAHGGMTIRDVVDPTCDRS